MVQTRIMMGMPIIIEIVDEKADDSAFEKAFGYLDYVDKVFSTYKPNSEISKINRGEIKSENYSSDMKLIFDLAEKTKQETNGYFDIIDNSGKYNPSGIVKGWAILEASKLILKMGFKNFYVNAGGDIQFYGKNAEGKLWATGIKNPFKQDEIVKVIYLGGGDPPSPEGFGEARGIATSGNYIRGDHIYNPKDRKNTVNEIVSFTVIGPDVCEADRFATAVFAMGKSGIHFLENMKNFAGYMIDKNGIASMTSNLEKYTKPE